MSTTIPTRPPLSSATGATDDYVVSVVIPCLNEEENIVAVVTQARQALDDAEIAGEVIVADNASEDRSAELATEAGARVVHVPVRGYGSAYLGGFNAAKGRYIVMGDADLTYDFHEIPNFVRELDDGADLVMGNRMNNIQPGAMPWLHRYVGNPLLSGFLNVLFRTGVRDAHCGMRAVRRSALPAMDLRTPGMEFASEMVIRASKAKLDIREFDIQYHPRGGESKLSTWRDGWRHLRFLLAHSPTHLFLIPGLVLLTLGALAMVTVLTGVSLFGREWSIHSLIAGSLGTIVGIQVISLGLCAHAYGMYFMGDVDPWFDRMRSRYRLEHGLAIGGLLTVVGIVAAAVIVIRWASQDFGALSETKLAIASVTMIVIGLQVFFSSFLLSIIGLRRDR
ncbi:glycosyl transferase family 2 [Patulibacter medicamentivorans]|jgi:hypothetical protein|uniref:Glycosyl transferase family 2 n=1 Tax=Patulibacter medicamentivorans TaxID=1097667 RepID=H0E3N2_9ACTN|nr:glycosyltransferase family 2 protein [Patulibacter medicamentivorans]EHN11734.1 glycosyl transferase family 2 [Patulibacter medicamentivorans]